MRPSMMFEAAAYKFAKSVGAESLIPVPNLDQAERCQLLQVVVRKSRYWFWQSPKYEVTPFKLNQLLTIQDEFKDCELKERPLTTYNKTDSFDLHGKIGGALKTLFDVELSGSDVVSVESKFGDIAKLEIDQPKLMAQVQNRALNVEHQFVKHVRESKRRVLCVIVGSAQLVADGSIHMTKDITGGDKVDVDLSSVPSVGKDETEDTSVEEKSDKSMKIPTGTPVAYNLCQLYVHKDGRLELVVDTQGQGGFENSEVDEDEVDCMIEDLSLAAQFKGILDLSASDRENLRKAVLQLAAKPMDIQRLNKVFKESLNYAIIGGEASATAKLEGFVDVENVKNVLQLAGMEVSEANEVTFSRTLPKSSTSIAALFAALMELDDDQTVALRAICGNVGELMHLIGNALEHEPTPVSDPKVAKLFHESTGTKAFAKKLGFDVAEDGSLKHAGNNDHELEGAYRAVYALWWTDEEAEEFDSKGWCTIL